jgi:hypothetical protein
VEAPPPDDRLVFEIEEGQTEIKLGPKNMIQGGADLPVARYEYSGRQDDDGNAIFDLVTASPSAQPEWCSGPGY